MPQLYVIRISLLLIFVVILSGSVAKAMSTTEPSSERLVAQRRQPPPSRKAPGRPSASAMFRQGQELYEAEKYDAAIAVFDRLLRVYPGHTSAMVLYARSLYQLERLDEAYYVFARVSPNILDPEASYEYAMSFYRQGQFEGALFGFQRVSKDHVLSDLANYYGGLAALRMRRYQEAEEMLEKAVVLPEKLAKSRAMYLKHLVDLKLLQERQALIKQRQLEAEILKQERQQVSRDGTRVGAGSAGGAATQEAEYKHSGFYGIERLASAGYSQKTQSQDFHGYAKATAEVRQGFFEFAQGPQFTLDHWGTRRPIAAVQLRFRAVDETTDGEQRRNVVLDDSSDIVRLYSESTRRHTKYGEVALSPWGEFPLVHDLWLGMGIEVFFRYPDFERAGRSGNRSIFFDLSRRFDQAWLQGHVSYFETVNSETKPTVNRTRARLSGGYSAIPEVLLEFALVGEQFNYPITGIGGPDDSYRLHVEAAHQMPLGFSLGIRGILETQFNHVATNIGSYDAVAADGQTYTGLVYLVMQPTKWISAEISQSMQSSQWKVVDPQEAQDVFERHQPDLLSEFRGLVTLNLMF